MVSSTIGISLASKSSSTYDVTSRWLAGLPMPNLSRSITCTKRTWSHAWTADIIILRGLSNPNSIMNLKEFDFIIATNVNAVLCTLCCLVCEVVWNQSSKQWSVTGHFRPILVYMTNQINLVGHIFTVHFQWGSHWYRIAGKFGREKLWWICSFWFGGKSWWLNRSANRLSIVTTNLDGFSLANHGRFTKLSRYAVVYNKVPILNKRPINFRWLFWALGNYSKVITVA